MNRSTSGMGLGMRDCNGKGWLGWDSGAAGTGGWYTMCYVNQRRREEVAESEPGRHAERDTFQNPAGEVAFPLQVVSVPAS